MNSVAATAGAAVDQLLGEPPISWHPVARYGSLMQRVERRIYVDRRLSGVALAMTGIGLGIAVGVSLRRTIGSRMATVAATTICAAGRMLDDEARRVSRLLHDGDLHSARQQVRRLVGRNTEQLDESEISRAVIESVAENCVDAITASLFWGTIAGAPGVLAHRAVNTLDAMVGHRGDRYERFGWASARLDDVANFLPARLTAVSVAVVRPRCAGEIWRVVRRERTSAPVTERRCDRGCVRRRARRPSRRRQSIRQRHRGSGNARQRTATDVRRHRSRNSTAAPRDGGVRARFFSRCKPSPR